VNVGRLADYCLPKPGPDGPCATGALGPQPQLEGITRTTGDLPLVCRARNSVRRFVAGWMHRKAEEEAASSANGDDENAARRRLGAQIGSEFSGEGHWVEGSIPPRRRRHHGSRQTGSTRVVPYALRGDAE
jgi:hypothetical protein